MPQFVRHPLPVTTSSASPARAMRAAWLGLVAGCLLSTSCLAAPEPASPKASAPVAAYLRFLSRSAPDVAVEGFSDDAGVASVRLVAGRYDVLVDAPHVVCQDR